MRPISCTNFPKQFKFGWNFSFFDYKFQWCDCHNILHSQILWCHIGSLGHQKFTDQMTLFNMADKISCPRWQASLMNCVLVMPYAIRHFGQHWFRSCLWPVRCQAITWTNASWFIDSHKLSQNTYLFFQEKAFEIIVCTRKSIRNYSLQNVRTFL